MQNKCSICAGCFSLSGLAAGGYFRVVNEKGDQELVKAYAGQRSEAAFAELVRRYVDFVYSAAVRMVRDRQLAEDLTQGTFVALAQEAGRLTERPTIAGWLHRTTHHLAAKAVRTETRRRAREQEAVTMNEVNSDTTKEAWDQLAPHLDAALNDLKDAERDAVVLRYFQQKSAREIGQVLGLNEDAAQKRVERALDHLRAAMHARGVALSTAVLATAVLAHSVHAAPVALAGGVAAAAIAGTSGTNALSLTTVLKTLVMTKTKMTMLTVAVAAAVSTPVVLQQHANSRLRQDLAEVREENARLQESQAQASQAPAQSADTAANENASQTPQANLELIRLRAAATRGAAAEAELTQLKAELQRVRASGATRVGGGGGGPGAGPSADALAEYIGKPVDAPAEITPAYTKDGLINALQTAAQKAGVSLKKVTIEDSEYPFLAGVICEKAADFEKMKAEFKKMEGYEYGGSVSSDTCYAFNLVPSRVFPAEQSQSIQRRIILRQQRFYHDLNL